MKKLITSSIITLIILGSVNTQIGAQTTYQSLVSVEIDGVKQVFDHPPAIKNDFTLVPLRTIFESFGVEVGWDGLNRKVTAMKDSTTITLTVGSRNAIKNGFPIQLDVEPIIMNGRTMVPLRFVSEAFGADVKWDGSTRTINIVKRSVAEEHHRKLSFEEALTYSIKKSYELKNAAADIERTQEIRDRTSDKLDYIPSGYGNGMEDAVLRASVLGLVQADLAAQMSKKQTEVKQDILFYTVKRAYNEVLLRQKEKYLDILAVEQAKLKLDQTTLKVNSGLASSFDENQATNNYKEAMEKKELAVKALDLAYIKLNQLIGLLESDRIVLSDVPTFSIFNGVDVEAYVRKVTNESSAVWLAEKQVDLAQLGVDLYTYNTGSVESYRTKEIDVEKAKNNLAVTKQQLDEGIRTLYNNIKQLENQYTLLEVNLAKANEGVKLVQVRYDLGMVTGLELAEAKFGVQQIEQQMFSIVIQLDNLKAAFEKPWVISGR